MTDTRLFSEKFFKNIPVSEKLIIKEPKEGAVFSPDKNEQTRLICVRGILDKTEIGKGRKLLVVIRTDRDYPQALALAKEKWEFSECRLGGIDHEILAVLLDFEDKPILKSKPVKVRLQRQ